MTNEIFVTSHREESRSHTVGEIIVGRENVCNIGKRISAMQYGPSATSGWFCSVCPCLRMHKLLLERRRRHQHMTEECRLYIGCLRVVVSVFSQFRSRNPVENFASTYAIPISLLVCRPPDQIRCKCICHFPRSSPYRGEAFRLRVVLLDADLRLLGHGGHATTPVFAQREQIVCPF